jgi:hypothetical protein
MRTLLDLAEVTGPDVLERAVAEAEATLGVRHEALTEYAEQATGRHGAGNLRAVLTRQGGPALTRSEAERRLLDLIRAAGLPAPEVNAPVAGCAAATREGRNQAVNSVGNRNGSGP